MLINISRPNTFQPFKVAFNNLESTECLSVILGYVIKLLANYTKFCEN